MSDRLRKRRFRRRSLYRVLFFALVVALWQWRGPSVALVRSEALAPLLQPGDVVLILPARNGFSPGDVVLSDLPLSEGKLASLLGNRGDDKDQGERRLVYPTDVPRIVVAVAEDFVAWSDRRVVVRREDIRESYALLPIDPRLTQSTRQRDLQAEEVFLVTLRPGYADSRILGPVTTDTIRYKTTRILWPANRRTTLDGRPYLSTSP